MAGSTAGRSLAEAIGSEVDSAASFALQGWHQRTGGTSCHDASVRPTTLRVVVGNDQVLSRAPQPCAEDVPDFPPTHFRSRRLGSRPGSKGDPATSTLVAGGLSSLLMSPRWGAPPEKPTPTPRRHLLSDSYPTFGEIEEFLVPDFVVMESVTLADMYWKQGGGSTVGPVRRSAAMFPAVLGLLKLRWLVRLDAAVRELCSDGPAARFAGFHNLLESLVEILCELNDCAYSPIEAYELCLVALRAKFASAWPLFLAYVNAHDRGVSRNAVKGMSSMSNASTSISSTVNPACRRAADDTFVAWLSRQESTASDVMEEFDYYGVPAPVVRTSFPNLLSWSKASYTTRHRFVRDARLDAAHLTVLLEMPSLRDTWALDAERTLHLVREVCTSPRTFSPRIRSRLSSSLLRGPRGPPGPFNVLAQEVNEDQLREVWSATCCPGDVGGLDSVALEVLRGGRPPWPVGGDIAGSRLQKAPPARLPSGASRGAVATSAARARWVGIGMR